MRTRSAGVGPEPAGARTRALAAMVVQRVLEGQALDASLASGLTSVLAGVFPAALPDASSDTMNERDRAQVSALAYGAVRWHLRHVVVLRELLSRPLRSRTPEALLSVGLFQLADGTQPPYAVLSTTVAAARLLGESHAAGLVNAVLRRYQREATALTTRLQADDQARFAHPAWLIARLRAGYPDRAEDILHANQAHPPFWLRVNRLRTSVPEYRQQLAAAGLASGTLAGFPWAIRLTDPVPVGALPGFDQGQVTVQDAAAQLAAPLLDPGPGMHVLDACSAPGGKATHLLEYAGERLDLAAVDISPERQQRLFQSLQRLGLYRPGMDARVITGDVLRPQGWWDGRPFDRILLDAPCSATGVIRRHPDIKLLRRSEDIPVLAMRQRQLLDTLWPLLRPGGRLLYATCSVLEEENQAVVRDFLAARPDARPVRLDLAALGGIAAGTGWQFLPDPMAIDGFYYALMERGGG